MRALLLSLTLGTALVLAACVSNRTRSTSKNATASGKNEPEMICHEEAPTGSMFTHTVCRSTEQVEDERNQGQDFMRRQRGTPDQPVQPIQPVGGPR